MGAGLEKIHKFIKNEKEPEKKEDDKGKKKEDTKDEEAKKDAKK